MHKHPTLVHAVADHRRAALRADAAASAWDVTPAARTRRWRRERRLQRLVEGVTDLLSLIVEDFEPIPSPTMPPVKQTSV